jgi:hypothetical protein
LRGSERDGSGGAEWAVGDNRMACGANGGGKESPTNSSIGIREGRDGLMGYAAGRGVASEVGGGLVVHSEPTLVYWAFPCA